MQHLKKYLDILFKYKGIKCVIFYIICMTIFNEYIRVEESVPVKENVDWAIGILSSREHFEQRSVIRQTWLADLDDLEKEHDIKIRAYFIVANSSCILDDYPLLKSDEFSCDQIFLNESLKEANNFRTHKLDDLKSSNEIDDNHLYQGFIFQSNWNLMIKSIGILKDVLEQEKEFKINLVDLLNDKIVTNVSQKHKQSMAEIDDGYIYFDLKPLNLKKGFAYQIQLENKIKQTDHLVNGKRTSRNDNFNLIKILDLVDDDFTVLNNLNRYSTAISFQYELRDAEDAQSIFINKEDFLKKQKLIDKKLTDESKIYGDIFLTDSKETYRNLPEKLLQFISHLDHLYTVKYFLKSDDDTFLNLNRIIKYFKSFKNDDKKSWFGSFRKNWHVNKWGKWLEPNYQSVVYPPFACGSAYVLQSDLVSWLSKNKNDLFRYQGEDVSMGIWLSSVLPSYRNDKRWNYDKSSIRKKDDFFSVGQISSKDQIKIFKHLR